MSVLKSTTYKNNARTISGLNNTVYADDVTLNCDTSVGAVSLTLASIPADYWNTVYKLYVTDISNNAVTNNITINAPAGFTINGLASYVVITNGLSIQLFITSNTNYGISNGVNAPVINQVDNTPFGPAWASVTTKAPSEKVLYDKIITIGAGFGRTAYVRTGGDDTTGIIGNYLMPFATPGGAIAALGMMANSAMVIDSGLYNLDDLTAPYGLKAPGSKYDIYFNVGAEIHYSGSFGMYCIDGTDGSVGQIYGQGKLVNYSSTASKSVNTKNNYAFNWANVPGSNVYQFNQILSEANTGTLGLIRIGLNGGGGGTGNAQIDVDTRAYCRTGVTVTLDNGCSAIIRGNGTYDSIGQNNETGASTIDNYALLINEPHNCTIDTTIFTSRGTSFGNVNTKCVSIVNSSNGSIFFKYSYITCLQAPVGYTLILLSIVPFSVPAVTFQNCINKNHSPSPGFPFTTNGNGFFTNSNTTIKIIDTYNERASGGTGTITNYITTGLGLVIEPNL